MDNIIFEISGGIGKSIVATAVIRALKKQYPAKNIIVQTAYPEIFLNNPNVYRIYRHGAPYFYDNHIKDHNAQFILNDVYRCTSYLLGTKTQAECWCEQNNIEYDGNQPELYLNPLELVRARNKIQTQKPVLLIQPFCGFSTEIKYNWNRDLPPHQIFEIASTLSKKYEIFQIGRPDQIQVPNTTLMHSNDLRDLLSLIAISDARLGVDSFMQHAAAAFKLPSVVCWITNKPLVAGYNLHTNIFPSADINPNISTINGNHQLHDFNGNTTFDFPFYHTNIFDVNEIIAKF